MFNLVCEEFKAIFEQSKDFNYKLKYGGDMIFQDLYEGE